MAVGALAKKIPFGKTALFGAGGWALYEAAPTAERAQYLKDVGVPDFMVSALQFMTPDKSKEWLQANVFNEAGLRNLTSKAGDAAAAITEEGAEAAVAAEWAGRFAWWETALTFLDDAFGDNTFLLGIANFIRKFQGKDPLIKTNLQENGGYLTASEIDTLEKTQDTSSATTIEQEIAAANIDAAPGTVQVTTDFGNQSISVPTANGEKIIEIPKFYNSAFTEAARDLGIELSEDLSLEDAIEIATKADPLSADEFKALMDDEIAKGLFQKAYDEARRDGWDPTDFSGNISGFFREVHDGMAANVNAPLSTMVAAFKIDLR